MGERESTVGKENVGRTTIDDPRRLKHSKRAMADKLSVVRRRCPACGHHKAFVNTVTIRCTRCRHEKRK